MQLLYSTSVKVTRTRIRRRIGETTSEMEKFKANMTLEQKIRVHLKIIK